MVLTITVPDRFSWVLLTSVSSAWLTLWQTRLVGRARGAAKIKYPQAYAEKAEAQESEAAMKFNCANRAHQNTLEFLPQTILCMWVTGLKYPELATGLGAAWFVGRVMYTLGYATGDPNKRRRGGFNMLASILLYGTATWTAGKFVLSTL